MAQVDERLTPRRTSKTPPPGWRGLFSRSTIVTLAIAWVTTIVFLTVGHEFVTHPPNAAVAVVCFVLILGAIMVAAFGVVRQAEHLAEKVGEPFGTLILTLTVVVIEVVLIASIMLGPGRVGHDRARLAVRGHDDHHQRRPRAHDPARGAQVRTAALQHGGRVDLHRDDRRAVAVSRSCCPASSARPSDGSLVPLQSIGIAAAVRRAVHLLPLHADRHATGRSSCSRSRIVRASDALRHAASEREQAIAARELIIRAALLVATVLPIILLAHDLGILVDRGIALTGAPVALGGVIIAIIVFTPEAITAVRAALANENQRALNLGLGAFVSTVGLTIPAILVIGLVTGQPVILGESPGNMVLICITLVMTVITYFAPRTTAVHGAVHLMLFGVYGILLFAP